MPKHHKYYQIPFNGINSIIPTTLITSTIPPPERHAYAGRGLDGA